MHNKPLISVVMSSYNREKLLPESIESILNQSYKNFEFIIIDDASTDNSYNLLEEYAQKDKRIILYKNEKNMGCNYTARYGLSKAKGKYIARMDDDDVSHFKRLEKQIKFMEKNPKITVLGTYMKIIGKTKIKGWVDETEPQMLELLLNFYNPICHPSVMIRKSFLEENNNLTYNPEDTFAIEYNLWSNIILKGGKLTNLPEELLFYRGHLNRITENPQTNKIQSEIATKAKYKLLKRFIDNDEIIYQIIDNTILYPTGNYNPDKVIESILLVYEANKEKKILEEDVFKKLISKIRFNSAYTLMEKIKVLLSVKQF